MTSVHLASRRAASGMTLVEVLVTLVLISVGLLGVAALQLTSLKSNQEAYVRSQASALAGYILDRMRANPIALRAGEYRVAMDDAGPAGRRSGDDLAAWRAQIARLLPGGDDAGGSVQYDADDPRIVTITIRWTERGENGAENTQPTFVTRTEI